MRVAADLFSVRVPMKRIAFLLAFSVTALAPAAFAELKLPAIIGDHMVLQQKQTNPIWGWDTPGTRVTVTFAGQNVKDYLLIYRKRKKN